LSYLVFARKFRPQSFDEVSGQETVVTTLRNALRSGRIAHAFCFAGPRGVGKTTTARLLAKALNCEKAPTADPCGGCSSCREVTDGNSLDVLEIDGASNRGIEDVKQLRESVQYNPARDRHKVVIIDEVHMLSTPAFNALLKTLEEPPPHVKFVFATTELHKVPQTILSRCQVYEFHRIPFRKMVDRLRSIAEREKVSVDDDALAVIAHNSDGCMRDAESMLDQVVAFGGDVIDETLVRSVLGLIGNDLLFETVDAIAAEDAARALLHVDRVLDAGTDPRQFAARLGEHLRNLLVAKVVEEPGDLIPASESDLARTREQASGIREDELLRLLNLVAAADDDFKRTSAPRFTLERLVLRLIQARRLTPLPELIAAVSGGELTTRPADARGQSVTKAKATPNNDEPKAEKRPAPRPRPAPARAPAEVAVPEAGPSDPAPASTADAADPRRQSAEEHPAVQKARDLFKADIADVEDPN